MTESNQNDTDAILQLEKEVMAAIKSKNASALGNFLTDDFVYRTHFGAESTKQEFLQSIATIPVEII